MVAITRRDLEESKIDINALREMLHLSAAARKKEETMPDMPMSDTGMNPADMMKPGSEAPKSDAPKPDAAPDNEVAMKDAIMGEFTVSSKIAARVLEAAMKMPWFKDATADNIGKMIQDNIKDFPELLGKSEPGAKSKADVPWMY
jgi:hypothetical protein